MEDQVLRYLNDYSTLLYKTEVTDREGQAMSFSQGVERTIALLRQAAAHNGKVMFIGNGGSAAIANHFALDYWHAGGIRSIAFNDGSQLTCLSNDHGYEQVFAMPVKMFANPGDILVAISSSGNSTNILHGVEAARVRECSVITLSGFTPGNNLRRIGDLNIFVPSSSYGFVESSHSLILHCILDLLKA